ncbi:CLUMA_CG017707, isoform A [Clunio marinus]|uniref:CLUMA_CG017707, isoform A n=1 Tax=Clunio marinus TaxID=568069 RepID=A0A1J1IX08_9DIPT|nr:CLUMA_CG017707, isoform A [Clunio marinus]
MQQQQTIYYFLSLPDALSTKHENPKDSFVFPVFVSEMLETVREKCETFFFSSVDVVAMFMTLYNIFICDYLFSAIANDR